MISTLKVDAGATKTDWLLAIDDKAHLLRTEGINPVAQSRDVVADIISNQLIQAQIVPKFPSLKNIDRVEFYGAGCTESLSLLMREIINEAFAHYNISIGEIVVGSDIVGAAVALFGNEAGIACILGTGANSCVYDGRRIVANTPPLGFILGDEGSGAAIGRRLLNNLYKGHFGDNLKQLFEEETSLHYDDIINNVYRKPLAGRFLASLSEFVGRHIGEYECLRQMVEDEFCLFIDRNIEPYHRHDLKIGAVGSVAWNYRDILSAAITKKNYQVGKIIKSPLGRLEE